MAAKEKVTWNCAVQIPGGPVVSVGDQMEIVGYEKYRLIIADGGTGTASVGEADGVQLLAIVPDKPSADLTYKIGSTEISLDRALVLAGEGAVSFVEDVFPDIKIKNATGGDVSVDILVVRV
jgi:hypothetical protein